jgi:hypothetical protein
MTTLPALIAAAHAATRTAWETGKSGTQTPEYRAAVARKRTAYAAVAERLAALGRAHGEDDIDVLVILFAQAERGDLVGAGERWGKVVGEMEEEGKVAA